LDEEGDNANPRWGVFATTVVAFFIAEMGDKTQIATVMLAAQFQSWFWVVAGTTLGMMLANAPVVWLGEAITRKISLTWVHRVSAVIFAILGALALWGGPAPDSEKQLTAPQAVPTALAQGLSTAQL
jgi:putative Ca2+/H+ antiporter (TMEM165/GDT1 family)